MIRLDTVRVIMHALYAALDTEMIMMDMVMVKDKSGLEWTQSG